MNPIVLCDRFTFVAPGGGGGVTFPWLKIDSTFKNWDLWIDAHSVETGSVNVAVETGIDTAQEQGLFAVAIAATGVTASSSTSPAGALARLRISSSGTARIVVSVWLVPKQE